MNYWQQQSRALAAAFIASGGTLTATLALKALTEYLPDADARTIDVGGGDGRMAIALARLGHRVKLVDTDPAMIAAARRALEALPSEISARVDLIAGTGEEAAAHGVGYNLVCCHSVIMYEAEPASLIAALAALARPGGAVSVIGVNPAALAMRPGLQGRWAEAVETLACGEKSSARYAASVDHSRETVTALFERHGLSLLGWRGIGIFTDHLEGPVEAEEPGHVVEAEWLAGARDPYRQVARCYHLIARKID
ncbi:methyltransferase [Parasphingopyxis lamellibrachiae]|uniref:Methyltransferase family protein n=1 Tax=Parasphingopyxis lamellibrachiae TaxID=680125 RepID=A0A3D9FE28_9SPHN|nr:methyltransferase [Parasphingopyxis lamellibrachiae]RED15296.1 methyltransferase family protein [Parasphingopyxis lamellibrachiae]